MFCTEKIPIVLVFLGLIWLYRAKFWCSSGFNCGQYYIEKVMIDFFSHPVCKFVLGKVE